MAIFTNTSAQHKFHGQVRSFGKARHKIRRLGTEPNEVLSKCLFAAAPFMLALIGVKKFRSFRKPSRIDVLEKKTSVLGPGGGECRGVAGVRGTAPEPVWGPRGEIRAMENIGSECNFDKQLAIICRGFVSLSRVSIGRFAAWSATSQLPVGMFLSS